MLPVTLGDALADAVADNDVVPVTLADTDADGARLPVTERVLFVEKESDGVGEGEGTAQRKPRAPSRGLPAGPRVAKGEKNVKNGDAWPGRSQIIFG